MVKKVKKLYRSEDDKMIAGVCGGIAEYFNLDPVLIRVLALALLFMGGGFLAYLILWIVVPTKSEVVKPTTSKKKK